LKRKASAHAEGETARARDRDQQQFPPKRHMLDLAGHQKIPLVLSDSVHNPDRQIDEEPSPVEEKSVKRRRKNKNKPPTDKTETPSGSSVVDFPAKSSKGHNTKPPEVPRTHVDYCMSHHTAHVVTASCQFTVQRYGKTPKKNEWRSMLGEDIFTQACRSTVYPPGDFFDAMTCITILYESFRGWPEWVVERDSRQIKVTEWLQKRQTDPGLADFFMVMCCMANYTSATLIDEIENLTKGFVQAFSDLYKKMDATDDFDPKHLSKDDKLRAIIAQKQGRVAHVPAYDAALFAKFADSIEAAINQRDNDIYMIRTKIIHFCTQERNLLATEDAQYMDEFLLVDGCIVSYAVGQSQSPMPTIVLPDLNEVFNESMAYTSATDTTGHDPMAGVNADA